MFVYWVLYICVESYIVLFRPLLVFLVQLYVSHRSVIGVKGYLV